MECSTNHADDQPDFGALVCVADLDKLAAVTFILDAHSPPVQLRIVDNDPLIVSITWRTSDSTARREFWTPPPEHTNHVHALGALFWHLRQPQRAGWRRAYGEPLTGRGGA